MDADLALAIQRRGFEDLIELLGRSAPESQLFELEGVRAAIVPATPRRSVPNSVTYADVGALDKALQKLAAAYERAGVEAWTVWTPDSDAEASAMLTDAGHKLDATPAAMVLDLAELAAPEAEGLDWDAKPAPGLLGELNDRAYGHDGEGFGAALGAPPSDIGLRVYQARVGGTPVCVVGTIDHEPATGAPGWDCGVYFAATLPGHRGHGLASRLLGIALAEARERGCATSSLQATALGEPVYEALGYRTHFRFHMYERRRERPAGEG